MKIENIKQVVTDFGNYGIIDFENDNKDKLRGLFSGSFFQSVTYKDNRKFELTSDFFKCFNIPFINGNYHNTLLLGGGCYTYPKYYISHYLDKLMTVVEIDKKLTEIAYEYFYLKELYETFDKNKKRLRTINDDALHYISHSQDKYDVIIIDLFKDNIFVKEIFNENILNKLNALLNDNGFIFINTIISNEEDKDILCKIEAYYKTRYPYVKVVTLKLNENESNNYFILVSFKEIVLPNDIELYEKNSNHFKASR